MLSLKSRGVRSGFDWDDENQERKLGFLMSDRCKPGDKWAARSRGIVRVARHRKREAQWNTIRVNITGAERSEVKTRMDQIMVHELLDMLPYTERGIVAAALDTNDERRIKRAGRIVRKLLPGLEGYTPPTI